MLDTHPKMKTHGIADAYRRGSGYLTLAGTHIHGTSGNPWYRDARNRTREVPNAIRSEFENGGKYSSVV